MESFPWGNLITAISTLFAVILTATITSRRGFRAKLWDLKREAYGEILHNLREGIAHLQEVAASQRAGNNDAAIAANRRVEEAANAARICVVRGSVFLPEHFLAAYDEYTAELLKAATSENEDRVQAEIAVIQSHRIKLQQLARSEIMKG
ncbi:hypothetical protein SAMN05216304_102740 [Bosea sp. OK403]|uniref:hypothetical protein n=1 Tax=Bosea sp. OK403 TaxID=1855286 RepID=UPI0008EFB24D|nr:hypothetical protein [Bosea sp. OK403]SFI43536.1 hypothetical protein SAMN05216304_102740 [Bosea sp. OK403]